MSGAEKLIESQQAGAALRESEEHYRAVAEAATDAIITIDSDSTILIVNPATERIFGYSTEEMIGQPLTMLMPEYLRHLHKSGITRYLETGRKHIQWAAVQLPGLHKSGAEIPLEISFAEFTNDGRRFFTGIARDISERKRLQDKQARLARHAVLHAEVSAAVSESEKSLRAMLEICAAAVVRHLDAAFARIWLLNEEQKVLKLEASAGLYTNLDGQHAHIPLGSFKIGLIAAEQKPHLTNSVQSDDRVSDKDWAQREGMISFAGYPLLVEGRTVGVIAMFAQESLEQDTIEALESVAPIIAQGIERKRTQDTLRETQRLIQAIFDNSSAVIHVKDLDGRFLLVNRKFEEVVGLKSQEILGKTSFDLFPLNASAYDAADREVIETGSASETEEVLITERGNHIFLTTKSLLSDESGKPYALFGISAEITERKKVESDLREIQAELAHLNRVMTVGELTASIAHEINQPLAAIVMNGNAALRWLALDPPNLARARDSAELIIRDGDRASHVIARIRALLKKAPPSKTLLDVNEFVLEVVDLTQSEMVRNRVRLRVELAGDLPRVPGDRIQLQQVMLNLIANAVEAMRAIQDRQRALLITTDIIDNTVVRLAVSDNGPGIDSQTAQHLFNAFSTTKPEGMGVGLAISRSIIEAHGGRLWTEANDEFGATFQFTLPIVANES
ncbi:MAG TPA: PAS domain S-box protein [Pyrinomonadaceae bacterium]|nr:PAS domain S-box protein [Pyrinomonadaceae bacterium]